MDVDAPASTATLEQARAHARAQAAANATTVVTIPSTAASDLPHGIAGADVIWDETIGIGGYTALRLPRHARLRITDVDGDACVGLVVFNAKQPAERSNVADTVKVQWNAYPGTNSIVLSDMGRALMTVVDDTSGRHDALCGGSTRAANDGRYGHGAIHGSTPAARELLIVAAAKHGLEPRDLPTTLNLFKGVRVDADGSLHFEGEPAPSRHVELRVDLDAIVLAVNVPHPLDPRPTYT
ncbi:MAG TPA: urea amidolyase associated protein UAAP1, partial [Acidimicrobiia bacterium]|nr:urea amidolyase associated protein UAAP1 [Acidimicrobiia bacterium]